MFLVRAAIAISLISVLLVFAGILITAYQYFQIRRSGLGRRYFPPRTAMLFVALIAIASQSIYFGLLKVPPQWYYFFGSFGVDVLFAWVAVEALARWRIQTLTIGLYGISVAIITFSTIYQVHQHGWPRDNMNVSPTLKEQIEMARALNHYDDESAWTDVAAYKSDQFAKPYDQPYALWALRELYPPEPRQTRTHSGRLVIRYRKGNSRRIELVEVIRPEDFPKDAKRISLMPKAR